jgi:hypothetical protein
MSSMQGISGRIAEQPPVGAAVANENREKVGVHQGSNDGRTGDREAAWGAQTQFMLEGRDAQGERTLAGNPKP